MTFQKLKQFIEDEKYNLAQSNDVEMFVINVDDLMLELEGFEKELRERKQSLTEHIIEHMTNGQQTIALESYRAIIKEILGE